jgi:outer membrane protein OmpA-like peptidoglycan-associated protein
MYKTLWTFTLLTVLAAAPAANAAEASREEKIGIGTGALIGAVAGGPVGLVAGIAIGAKLGDELHEKNSEIDTLTTALASSQREFEMLDADAGRLRREAGFARAEIRRLEQAARPELLDLVHAGIESDWLFRTGEFALADTTAAKLVELAVGLAKMPDIRIHLDGYADARGDADYNQALSEQRVEWVAARLIEAGIAPERISSSAYGELAAADGHADSLALDRRVNLTVFIEPGNSVASIGDE